jgi:nitrile hydratase accessory protein
MDERPADVQVGGDGPVFDEPWQAQAMALADSLVGEGLIEPAVWSQTLGAALRAAEARGEPDDRETYYRAVLAAVEDVLAAADYASSQEVGRKTEDWRNAYTSTPHGQPVVLRK